MQSKFASVNKEVLPWIPGLTRNFLVLPRTYFLVHPRHLWGVGNPMRKVPKTKPPFLHIQMPKRISFMLLLYLLSFTKHFLKNMMFLVDPETFGLKSLVSFLVPVSQNLNFLVLFQYPFWSYPGLPGFVPVPGNPLLFVPYLWDSH